MLLDGSRDTGVALMKDKSEKNSVLSVMLFITIDQVANIILQSTCLLESLYGDGL